MPMPWFLRQVPVVSSRFVNRRHFSYSRCTRMRVVPVPVRADNYAYLLIDDTTKKAAVVDPYDMPRVKTAADNEGVDIIANLTTHHHYDHSGGNKVKSSSFFDLRLIF